MKIRIQIDAVSSHQLWLLAMKVLNKVRDHPIANIKLQFLEILGLTLYCQHQLQNVSMFHPQFFMPWRRSITSALAASNESAQLS